MEENDLEVKDRSPVLLQDLGMRFPTEMSKKKYRYGRYRCGYCGKEFEAQTKDIKSGRTRSCGCQYYIRTHGFNKHKLYQTWNNMIQRCYNSNIENYKNYGARGITVCDEWRDTPEQFVKDMFPSFIEGLSLDRIDNSKGYSKENCRWATKTEQCTNQRISSRNTSGFIGVSFSKDKLKFICNLRVNKRHIHLGTYSTLIEAIVVRNNYIIENGLPNKLNIIPEEEIK